MRRVVRSLRCDAVSLSTRVAPGIENHRPERHRVAVRHPHDARRAAAQPHPRDWSGRDKGQIAELVRMLAPHPVLPSSAHAAAPAPGRGFFPLGAGLLAHILAQFRVSTLSHQGHGCHASKRSLAFFSRLSSLVPRLSSLSLIATVPAAVGAHLMPVDEASFGNEPPVQPRSAPNGVARLSRPTNSHHPIRIYIRSSPWSKRKLAAWFSFFSQAR